MSYAQYMPKSYKTRYDSECQRATFVLFFNYVLTNLAETRYNFWNMKNLGFRTYYYVR